MSHSGSRCVARLTRGGHSILTVVILTVALADFRSKRIISYIPRGKAKMSPQKDISTHTFHSGLNSFPRVPCRSGSDCILLRHLDGSGTPFVIPALVTLHRHRQYRRNASLAPQKRLALGILGGYEYDYRLLVLVPTRPPTQVTLNSLAVYHR
jgi:hypothetical protein